MTEKTVAGQIAGNIMFKDAEHREFFVTHLPKCRYRDEYHAALVYCLGIQADTRKKAGEIYDFKSGCIRTECLHGGWLTDEGAKAVRLAFSLYCSGTPSIHDYDDAKEQLTECRLYAVDELFASCHAKYFWQAVKLRYPGYCRKNDQGG